MRPCTPHRITAYLIAASVVVIAGCAPYSGYGYQPIGTNPNYYPYPGNPPYGTPIGGTVPINYPGGNPPVIWPPGTPNTIPTNPNTPRPPDQPVVLEPVPQNPDPGNNVPVNYPVPTSPTSPEVNSKWAAWPLPPRAAALQQGVNSVNGLAANQAQGMPHGAAVAPQSVTAAKYNLAAADEPAHERVTPASGTDAETSSPASNSDLHFQGGKTLQNISYVNLYVGGEPSGWKLDEVDKIEASIAAALTDQNLNNVLMQYFDNQPISTTPRPCHPLIGYKPAAVSRADLQHYIEYLADQSYLKNYDLTTTVFNFLLPPGTILTDQDQPAGVAANGTPVNDDGGDSTTGLGGFHGSALHNGQTIYFSVEVYSERRADGFRNGIPVFADAWKNVCATLYHEICEFRTDPDIENANRDPANSEAHKYLGWVSDNGEEIGDAPLQSGSSLRDVIQEVPLANGMGIVPVQFIYSNAVHGFEGPITAPHPNAAQ